MPQVQQPATVAKMSDVKMALEKWDGLLLDYLEAGGRRPTFDEMRSAVLNILPASFRQDMLFRMLVMQEKMLGTSIEHQDNAYRRMRA